MEHIKKNCSLESKLFLITICSTRVLNILKVIVKTNFSIFEKCLTLSRTGYSTQNILDLHAPVEFGLDCKKIRSSKNRLYSSDSQFRVLSGLICLLECDLLSLTARYAAFSVLIDSKQAFIRPNILTSLCKNNEESVSFLF